MAISGDLAVPTDSQQQLLMFATTGKNASVCRGGQKVLPIFGGCEFSCKSN